MVLLLLQVHIAPLTHTFNRFPERKPHTYMNRQTLHKLPAVLVSCFSVTQSSTGLRVKLSAASQCLLLWTLGRFNYTGVRNNCYGRAAATAVNSVDAELKCPMHFQLAPKWWLVQCKQCAWGHFDHNCTRSFTLLPLCFCSRLSHFIFRLFQ